MVKVASKANQSQGMLVFKLTLQQNFAIGTLKVREIVPYLPTIRFLILIIMLLVLSPFVTSLFPSLIWQLRLDFVLSKKVNIRIAI